MSAFKSSLCKYLASSAISSRWHQIFAQFDLKLGIPNFWFDTSSSLSQIFRSSATPRAWSRIVSYVISSGGSPLRQGATAPTPSPKNNKNWNKDNEWVKFIHRHNTPFKIWHSPFSFQFVQKMVNWDNFLKQKQSKYDRSHANKSSGKHIDI